MNQRFISSSKNFVNRVRMNGNKLISVVYQRYLICANFQEVSGLEPETC